MRHSGSEWKGRQQKDEKGREKREQNVEKRIKVEMSDGWEQRRNGMRIIGGEDCCGLMTELENSKWFKVPTV